MCTATFVLNIVTNMMNELKTMIIVLVTFVKRALGFVESEVKRAKGYGWRPSLPDHRDRIAAPKLTALPASVDMRSTCPPVYDQGQLGSCTGNAIAFAYEYDLKKQGKTDFTPSRLFIYYNERAMEGTISEDAGAAIRDGIKSINKLGVCKETTWPYVERKFKTKPSKKAFAEALQHQSVSYARVVQSQNDIKACLAAGLPVVFGFTVYDSFESETVAATGVLNIPTATESVIGGHAVAIVGYDDASKRFIVRNSWGSEWGQKGYFTMPYAYVTNPKLASDFWCVQTIEG